MAQHSHTNSTAVQEEFGNRFTAEGVPGWAEWWYGYGFFHVYWYSPAEGGGAKRVLIGSVPGPGWDAPRPNPLARQQIRECVERYVRSRLAGGEEARP